MKIDPTVKISSSDILLRFRRNEFKLDNIWPGIFAIQQNQPNEKKLSGKISQISASKPRLNVVVYTMDRKMRLNCFPSISLTFFPPA